MIIHKKILLIALFNISFVFSAHKSNSKSIENKQKINYILSNAAIIGGLQIAFLGSESLPQTAPVIGAVLVLTAITIGTIIHNALEDEKNHKKRHN